jgi:hypothetical protein
MISHRLLRNKTLSSKVSCARGQSRNSLQTHQEACHVHAQGATHRHHSHTPKIISSIPSRRTMHDQLFWRRWGTQPRTDRTRARHVRSTRRNKKLLSCRRLC